MAFSHTITRSVNAATGHGITKTNVYSGDASDFREIDVPDATTDQLVNFTLDISQIKSFYMVSTQDLTVETNAAAGTADVISLLADKPLLWQNDSYHANPFTVDITALYLTNASGAAAVFSLAVCHDATP